MDEIIRAVRDCPSGALSYAIDGREAREQTDYHNTREPVIEVSKDGPYRISGGIALIDGEGNDEHRNQGASLEHYALCRCGHSQNKPFCSGMHWHVDFHDRQSMKFAFDLWSYADVKQHAGAILERLRNGSMPCDGAWSQERVDVFQRWVDSDLSA